MFRLIGLGGSGAKFVRAWLESARPFSRALVVDCVNQNDPEIGNGDFEYCNLVKEGDELKAIVRAGISLSITAPDSQERLRDLATWRIDPEHFMMPLRMGAGRIRSIGRALAIAKQDEVREAIRTTLTDAQAGPVVIVSSTDGGMGSALIQDVLKTVLEHRSDSAKFEVRVILLNGLVFEGNMGGAVNAFWTLSELWVNCRRLPHVTFQVIQTDDATQVDAALHLFDDETSSLTEPSTEFTLSEGKNFSTRSTPETTRDLSTALQFSADRLYRRYKSIELVGRTTEWKYGRTRPLRESVACEETVIRNFVRGWISLLSQARLSVEDGIVKINSEGRDLEIAMLRPSSGTAIDALPIFLEALPLLTRVTKHDQSIAEVIDVVLMAGELFEAVPNLWTREVQSESNLTRTLDLDLAEHYGRLGTSTRDGRQAKAPGPDAQISYVEDQLQLALDFSKEPYNGEECVGPDGRVQPDSTLFRDIAPVYVEECQQFIDQAVERSARQRDDVKAIDRQRAESSSISIKKKQPRKVYAKPRMWIRYGVPAFLATVSILGTTIFLFSPRLRSVWSDTATAVGGIMGSIAVCLGAVALIWGIQNSSVETTRTDRLFAACLGIQEATHMLRIALQNATLTNDFHGSGSELWNHQSLRLAAVLLGRRLVEALDAGLFGLLISIDDDQASPANSLSTSVSRQVFVLLDDLVRVAPEIISERDAPIREKPAAPEKVLSLAENLRQLLEPVTYRYMAESLRRTPSSVDLFGGRESS